MKKYAHLVELNKDKQLLVISRLFEDETKELYTHIDFTKIREQPEKFLRMIGENIFLDTEIGREILTKINYKSP